MALAFAREGADVLISYLNEDSDAEEDRVVREAGRRRFWLPVIFPKKRIVGRWSSGRGRIGGLDILVNNAAYQMSRVGIEQIPDGEWERTFETNIFAMYYLSKAAWPHLQPGSSIINTASIQAYQPSPELLSYASTKARLSLSPRPWLRREQRKGFGSMWWLLARSGRH